MLARFRQEVYQSFGERADSAALRAAQKPPFAAQTGSERRNAHYDQGTQIAFLQI